MSPTLFLILCIIVCVSECVRREVFFERIHTLDNTEVTGWYNSQAVENCSECARACSDDNSCFFFSHGHVGGSCFRFSSHVRYFENVKSSRPGMVSFMKKGKCPPIYTQVEDMCVRVANDSVEYTEAVSRCQGDGAKLLSLNTREKYDDFYTYLSQNGYNLVTNRWLGSTDESVEGEWHWPDNSVVNSSLWCVGQPDNANNDENCMCMYKVSACLNDYRCSHAIPYICESMPTI